MQVPSPPAQMLPQLFVAGTFRCKCDAGHWMLISVAFLLGPLSRRASARTPILLHNMPCHGSVPTALKKKRKKDRKKVLIAFPPPTEPISYGLSRSLVLFSKNQPHGTPNLSPPGTSQRNSQWTNQGRVFPGSDFFLSESVDKNITVAFVHLNLEEEKLFTRVRFENLSLNWVCSHHGRICNVRLSGLQGCQQNNISPLWRGDRPYKECGLFYLPMPAANFVKKKKKNSV